MATKGLSVRSIKGEEPGRTLVPDIISGQSLINRCIAPSLDELGSVQAIITPGWNAYLVQVVLKQNGETRMLVGKEVNSYAEAETIARAYTAAHGVSCENPISR